MTSFMSKLGGLAIGAGALIASTFLGRDRGPDQTSELVNNVAPVAEAPEVPDLPSTDDYGGAKDALSSALTGVSNRENKRGTIPRAFGKKMLMYPAIAAHPYSIRTATGQIMKVVLDFGAGPLLIENIKIGGRPISEFPSISYEIRQGFDDDEPLTLYTNDVEQMSFNDQLKLRVALQKDCGQAGTTVSVDILIPDGIYRFDTAGKVAAAKVDFYIVLRHPELGVQVADYPSIEGIFYSPVAKTYTYSNLPEGVYDVFVARVQADANMIPDILHEAYWIGLTAYNSKPAFTPLKNANGDTINTAKIALSIETNANTPDLSGALGEVSAEVSSLLRAHDGTDWLDYEVSDNLAWVMTEVLTGSFNYRPAPLSRIDIDSFIAFAEWCDLCGYTFNWIFDSPQDMRTVLNTIAAAGQGFFIENRRGKYSVGVDKPVAEVSQHFTPRNIIKGSFSARVSYVTPIDYIAAQFINPDADFQLDERKVFAPGKVEGVDFERRVQQYVGSTKLDQVHKLASYQLADHLLRAWVYSFTVDVEHLTCEIGSKVRVTHDLLGWGLGQGRISEVITNLDGDVTAVKIDSPQMMELGQRYTVRIVLSNNDAVAKEVVAFDGETKILTFVEPIDSGDYLPEVGYMVMFGELDFDSAECLVTNIEPNEDFGATITCVDYIEAIYKAATEPVPAWESKITYPRKREKDVPQPVILATRSDEFVLDQNSDGSKRTRILIKLGGLPDYVTQLEWQIKKSSDENMGSSTFTSALGDSISIYDVQERETYDIQIRARSGSFFGPWARVNGHYVIGKTTPPPPVPKIVEREPNSTFIKWFYDEAHGVIVPPDFDYFIVKAAWGPYIDWARGYVLGAKVRSTRFDVGGLLFGVKTFMIKAVDVAGNESEGDPAIIQMDFGDAPIANVVLTTEHAPDFSLGTIDNCIVDDNKLKSADDGGLFWPPDESVFWPPDTATFWGSVNYTQGTYTWKYTPSPSEKKPFKIMVNRTITGPYVLEYRVFGSQLFWKSDSELFWPADAQPFWPDEPNPPYQPVPDAGIIGDWITYEFRLTLLPGSEQVVVESLSHVIDVQDVIEYVDDFEVTDTSGSRAPIVNVYRGIKSVQVTLQQSPAHPDAARAMYLDKDVSGPKIKVFDSAGVGTTGIVDVTIRGY